MASARIDHRLAALSAASVMAVMLLAGCSAPATHPTGAGATTAPSDSADDSTVGGGAVEGTSVPTSYPTKDVPLVSGDTVYGADLGVGWIVWIRADDFNAGFTRASSLLQKAGFKKTNETKDPTGDVAVFTDDDYQVIVTAGTDPTYGRAVGYTVTTK
jgi:hypothetical protein